MASPSVILSSFYPQNRLQPRKRDLLMTGGVLLCPLSEPRPQTDFVFGAFRRQQAENIVTSWNGIPRASVRNKGGSDGSDPSKSMRDPCKVVIFRDHGWVP